MSTSIRFVSRSVDPSDTEKDKFYQEDFTKVVDSIKADKYLYTTHARDRMLERGLTPAMIGDILLNGAHEVARDRWNSKKKSWAFSFYGKVKEKDIRVCVGVGKNSAEIITTVNMSLKHLTSVEHFTFLPRAMSSKEESSKSFKQEELDTSFDDLLRKKTDKGDSISISLPSAEHSKKRKLSPPSAKSLDLSFDDILRTKADKRKCISPPNAKEREEPSSVVKKKSGLVPKVKKPFSNRLF